MQPAPRQSLPISVCALAEVRINHDAFMMSLEADLMDSSDFVEVSRFDVAEFHLPQL